MREHSKEKEWHILYYTTGDSVTRRRGMLFVMDDGFVKICPVNMYDYYGIKWCANYKEVVTTSKDKARELYRDYKKLYDIDKVEDYYMKGIDEIIHKVTGSGWWTRFSNWVSGDWRIKNVV